MCNREIQRGDIYFCNFAPVVGSEQNGLRPAVIIQNDIGNHYSPTTIVAPLTTRIKRRLPTHVTVTNRCLKETSIVLLEQIRTIDKCRLKTYLGQLSKNEMKSVDDAINISLGTQEGENNVRVRI